ncbi:DegT/DnrJ/EryC1/StrS family aminotransferase [Spirillospora sp. NPDC050679]
MIPLFKVAMAEGAAAAVGAVLGSGLIGQGPVVEEFEAALRRRVGNPYLATVNSGSSALHLAVRLAAGARAGGEALSTPLTMEATNWAILAGGLDLRWVDVDPATLNMDLDDLARKITPATRLIMVVHFAGYPVDLARLARVLDEAEAAHGVRPVVVEDCAHAWGATYQGVPVGAHGNLSAFSFQAVKHLTCGDGGLLALPDAESHRRAKLLRWHGIDREAGDRLSDPPDVPEWGYKFHMNDVNAAIGLANLPLADRAVLRHRDNAAFYDRELKDVAGLELTERAGDREGSFWIYPVKVEDRPGFIRRLAEAGIAASPVHRRNDLHSCVRGHRAPLPGMDRVDDRLVCVPVGWWVSAEERRHIADTVRAGW